MGWLKHKKQKHVDFRSRNSVTKDKENNNMDRNLVNHNILGNLVISIEEIPITEPMINIPHKNESECRKKSLEYATIDVGSSGENTAASTLSYDDDETTNTTFRSPSWWNIFYNVKNHSSSFDDDFSQSIIASVDTNRSNEQHSFEITAHDDQINKSEIEKTTSPDEQQEYGAVEINCSSKQHSFEITDHDDQINKSEIEKTTSPDEQQEYEVVDTEYLKEQRFLRSRMVAKLGGTLSNRLKGMKTIFKKKSTAIQHSLSDPGSRTDVEQYQTLAVETPIVIKEGSSSTNDRQNNSSKSADAYQTLAVETPIVIKEGSSSTNDRQNNSSKSADAFFSVVEKAFMFEQVESMLLNDTSPVTKQPIEYDMVDSRVYDMTNERQAYNLTKNSIDSPIKEDEIVDDNTDETKSKTQFLKNLGSPFERTSSVDKFFYYVEKACMFDQIEKMVGIE